MRIEAAHVEMLEIPFRRPILSAAESWRVRRLGLVRLTGEDGVEGLGEIAAERPAGLDRPLPSIESLAGADARNEAWVETWLDHVDTVPSVGRPLRSAVESALSDLMSREAGTTMAASLSDQPSNTVDVNALIGIEAAEVAATKARGLVDQGFFSLKIKAGDEPVGAIIDRVAAVRSAVGSDVALRLDLNGALAPDVARELLIAIAPYRPEYVEQPIAPGSGPHVLAALRRASPVPIAADESVDGLDAARALIAAEAVDVFVVKPARVGGLRSAATIARAAAEVGLPTTISTLFETGIGIAGALHLAATLPRGQVHGLATASYLASDLLEQPLELSEGQLVVPNGAGLGVRLDSATLKAYGAP